ncbi:very short patch repair endonuclease [Paludibacterium denitrificans]|uniref:DNA mismatch endonuclease Vsr n=1 Tax=Paludibacterium denitrificans TaxID=2675226 RepID=A0A844GCB4_9NEIS|nr:very short patch repair endonuclease [Paludibacterium denitrificans]MTD34123.1 DNA mismatch endonuclease Vsr [Paludibacterium denitrificans]
MTDIVDKATRSRMMSGIKGKDTKPEIFIRKALHARGFRYRLHDKALPGKPDLVFPKYKAVVFIHGCFWHGHDCRYFKVPQTRTDFWLEKIAGNRQRDARQLAQLKQAGWRVLIVWECATRKNETLSKDMLIDCVADWLIMEDHDAHIDETGLHPLPCLTTESVTTPKALPPNT